MKVLAFYPNSLELLELHYMFSLKNNNLALADNILNDISQLLDTKSFYPYAKVDLAKYKNTVQAWKKLQKMDKQ